MIKSLKILDKSNLLLDHVAKPIRKYLISRKDTIRCIVSSITEKKDDLHNVLRDGGSLEYGMDSDDEAADLITANVCDNWNPPIRALDFPGTGSHDKDILALLVSIYGSTDLFVSEYRSILADRLLANSDYNIDTEVATLELLKIRFGEEPLHSCEVMLHDIDASKRMNQAVNSVMQNVDNKNNKIANIIDFSIVSDSYWPSLQSDNINHHPIAADMLKSFTETFAIVKKPKTLSILPQLGQVTIDLEFNDGIIREYIVNPVQASLILHISESDTIKLSELSSLSNLSPSEIKKWMQYWISKGVVKETLINESIDVSDLDPYENQGQEKNILYEIIENQAERENNQPNNQLDGMEMSDTHVFSSGVSIEAEESNILSNYETFIRGMLLNQESMHLERIHTMLKMLSTGNSNGARFDMNLVQLKKFLQKLVNSDVLEIIDGDYRLRK